MKQTITIIKICGKATNAVVSLFQQWLRGHTLGGAAEESLASFRAELKSFVECLRANATSLPILFYCEYLDAWSMGDIIDRFLTPTHGNQLLRASVDEYDIACYALPDHDVLASSLSAILGRELIKSESGQEEYWFARLLYEAVLSWQTISPTGAVVVIRHIVGPSVTDEEAIASLESVPAWLRRERAG